MNNEIKNQLVAKRDRVEAAYSEMIARHQMMMSYIEDRIITSKKFFFEVVADHFEKMSKVKINKCLKDEVWMIMEIQAAIDKAKYACAKPQRELNRVHFSNIKRGVTA